MTVSTLCLSIKKIFFIFTIFSLLSACSATPEPQAIGHKKPLINDHQLLLSLLNRPLPQDQIMMMQFAQQTYHNNSIFPQISVSYIAIRGEKKHDIGNNRSPIYSQLIYNDQNAIMIGAPQ